MNKKCIDDNRAQLSVNATVLFPHHIPASLFPGVKRGRPTLGDQGRLHGGQLAWTGKARESREIQLSKSPAASPSL